MRDPSKDTPVEVEIQSLLVNGQLDEARTKASNACRGEVVEYCTYTLRAYPEADAEGLAQEILEEFCCKLPSYDTSIASIHTYLSVIKKNRVIDEIRRLNRSIRNREMALSELKRNAITESYSQNPEIKLLEEEKERILQRGLSKLPSSKRQILHWHYNLGHSTVKIAQFTDVNEGTVRSQLSRARSELRAQISLKDYSMNGGIFYDIPGNHNHWSGFLADLEFLEPRRKNIIVRFWAKLKSAFNLGIFQYYRWGVGVIREYIEALFIRK